MDLSAAVRSALCAALVFSAACSSSQSSMSEHDRRVWEEARAKQAMAPLDGRTFELQMTATNGHESEHDVVEFAGGRFHSRGCDEFGFGTGAYTTKPVDGGVEFHARCTSDSGATNDWHGVVKGDAIDGGFTCTQHGGAPVEYQYKGHSVRP